MRYSVALPSSLHETALGHLLRPDGQEDLCFGIWYPSKGRSRTTALIHQLILPLDGERRVHGNASFLPEYFERALGIALAVGGGLAFFHSHGGPGWQGMSQDDVRAEQGHAAAAKGATGLPLVGLTLGTDGAWSARFWEKIGPRQYERRWCETVRVAGDRLSVTYMEELIPRPAFREELTRTISAWGEDAQADLARLRVGVVGAGSVGSLVAEALARMGIQHVQLLDFDAVELVNLDRLLYATRRDALLQRSKVSLLGRALRKSATAHKFTVEMLEWSISEEEGFQAALDCDVLFSCVDRPWPRSILNLIAYAHLIPVVDGGIAIEAKKNGRGIKHADWRAHVAAPGRRCLACLEQYDPGLVSMERDGYLDDPAYIAGLPVSHALRRNENVFGFSMSVASLEILQFLSMAVAPSGIANTGAQMYHFVTGTLDTNHCECEDVCAYPILVARGDACGVTMTGQHRIAEQARERRHQMKQRWRYRISYWWSALGDALASLRD